MQKRGSGFVTRYLTVTAAGSYRERDRREIWERVTIGEFPAMRIGSGEVVIPMEVLGVIDRRIHEHDA